MLSSGRVFHWLMLHIADFDHTCIRHRTEVVRRNMRQLRKGDVRMSPNRPWIARRETKPCQATPSSGVSWLVFWLPYTLPACLQENASLLAAVRRGRSKAASHGCQSPFLHISFDIYKAHLTEIDVHGARSVGTHGREEVLALEVVSEFVQSLAVTSEENRAGARLIANSDDIALDIGRPEWSWREWLIESPMAC